MKDEVSVRRICAVLSVCAGVLFASTALAQDFMPRDHRALTRTISYTEMESFLRSVEGKGPVQVSVAGTTTKGRSVYLVNLRRSTAPKWTILFYAQQHGDEISGKDAMLYLIREIAEDPKRLPPDVDLWIFPMMNPDGAEAGTRENGAGADLNRDHMTLEQPETIALHRTVQRLHPDIAVDCHEFARQSESYGRRGWEKWPDITMDGLNNPLFDRARRAAADRWIEGGGRAQSEAGHPYLRYSVGGVPPDDEQRHSAPDIDSAMNALATYGGLSFIIEAAARRGEGQQARELGTRVDAYLVMLRRFIAGDGRRRDDAAAIRAARTRPLPPFLPVNYFWANPEWAVTEFPVRSLESGARIPIATANMMTRIVVKKSVGTPLGYAVEPAAAGAFAELLDRHAIPYETLTERRAVSAESCTLMRVEEDFDEVYSRYEGRQIVKRGDAALRDLAAGSLWIPLEGESAVRAALLLEPLSLYGLYQYPKFRALVGPDGSVPVLRVVR